MLGGTKTKMRTKGFGNKHVSCKMPVERQDYAGEPLSQNNLFYGVFLCGADSKGLRHRPFVG